jgi:hypothetical protein
MESINTSTNKTLGVIENLPLHFGAGEMLFQVQVVLTAKFDVLLRQLFFTLTSCCMEDLPHSEQDIMLTDLNTGKVICILTNRWAKKCAGCKAGMLICTNSALYMVIDIFSSKFLPYTSSL